MYRKKIKDLESWKNSKNRKPIILMGARQVGKTYLLKQFGKENYENTIYVNFDKTLEKISDLFESDLDTKRIITNLEIYFGEKILPEKTLIIFDEIQENSRALTSLKYFYEDTPEYHIVASGSLLGVGIHPGTSFPVGKVDFIHLEPMDFEEFLIANGEEMLVNAYLNDINQVFDDKLYNYFKYYMLVGGMPEVVQSWVENQDIEKIGNLQNNILNSYLFDFSKHTESSVSKKINQIWNSIPKQFAKENDKFVWGLVKEGARAREYELALQWLIDSSIIRKVNRVQRGDKLPLLVYEETSAFKLYFLDVGLLRQLANIPSSVILDKNAIFDEYNGLFTEQFVLQNLNQYQMFYWTSGNQAEVDFVAQIDDKIVPIEVKSGENVKSKSLGIFTEKYNPNIAIRFSLKNTKLDEKLFNIALYHSFLFEKILKTI